MTSVTWRDYEPGDEYHVSCWRLPKVGTHDWYNFQKNLRSNRGFTFTFVDAKGRILGLAGMNFHCRGNAEVWSALNDDDLGMPGLAKAVRTLLQWGQRHFGIPRMWATGNPEEFDTLSRWFKFLGMEYEGLVDAWGPDGKDQHFFARIQRGGG